jgi:transcriptional regulator with XRE-family HTH domain
MTLHRIHARQTSGFPARLRQVLDRFGSVAAVAAAIGRSDGAVRKWLRGQSEPGVTDLRALCELTQTRIEWLVSGHGPAQDQPALHDPAPAYGARASLDAALLEEVLSILEQRLRETGTTLSAVKHATLVAACYDLAHESGEIDAHAIARLIKLAG